MTSRLDRDFHPFSELYPETVLNVIFPLLAVADSLRQSSDPEDQKKGIREWHVLSLIVSRMFADAQKRRNTHNFLLMSGDWRAMTGVRLEKEMVSLPLLLRAIADGLEEIPDWLKSPEEGKNLLVATVGRNNSGKGVVTEYLSEKYGFSAHPLSDAIRGIAQMEGHQPPHDREILIQTGNNVRERFGAGILMQLVTRIYSELGKGAKLLFDGIRTPEEARAFLNLANEDTQTILIGIKTSSDPKHDQEIRFQRALQRKSSKDPVADTPEEREKFYVLDQKEGPGIDEALEYVTYQIFNTGDVSILQIQCDEILRRTGLADNQAR